MSIITKKGDNGETDLINKRVKKTDLNIELIGTVDEAISMLSVANSFIENEKFSEEIAISQEALYQFNAQVAGAEYVDLSKFTDYFEESVKIHDNVDFVMSYTSTKPGSFIDCARAIVRRAERVFYKADIERADLKKFINRISDYLYVLSRTVDAEEKV